MILILGAPRQWHNSGSKSGGGVGGESKGGESSDIDGKSALFAKNW